MQSKNLNKDMNKELRTKNLELKIICITSVKHLKGVFEEMQKHGDVLYEPEIEKLALAKLLQKDKSINSIFTNPNKQNYKLDAEVLDGTGITLINTASTGMNHIDVKYCEKKGIKIFSLTKDMELINNLPSTAELAFGLMLSLLRQIPQSFDSVKAGEWDYEKFMGRQVAGLTAGIIGYGRLGKFMAKYCQAFGMRVLICDPFKEIPAGFEKADMNMISKESDVVSLHVHVADDTRHMINDDFVNKTVKKPYIINTARGELVDEKAVIKGIKTGKIAGYGADGIEDEFGSRAKSPIILAAKAGLNIIIAPHTGGMTWEGQQRAFMWAAKKFENV